MEIALSSPTHTLVLMSDACGATPVTERVLTFSDDATTTLPGGCPSGIYLPTVVGDGVDMPLLHPRVTTLAELLSGDPAGPRTLQVYDDAAGDGGTISGGWSLRLTYVPFAPATETATAASAPLTVLPPPPLELSCSGRPAQLLSLAKVGRRAVAKGIALPSYAGTTAAIVRTATKAVVATAPIGPDGTFTARWKRSARERRANPAYSLRLADGSLVESVRARAGLVVTRTVTTATTTVLTLTAPGGRGRLLVRRREDCTGYRTVATRRITRSGRVRVALPLPAAGQTVVYRLTVPRRLTTRVAVTG